MFFAASMAILDNICIFMGEGNIILYHLAMLFNLSWGAYLILFIKNLRSSGKYKIQFNWKLFIPSILYIPFIALCIIKPYWAHNTISFAEQSKMTVIGVLCNLTICFYSIITNVYLIWKVYRNKQHDAKIREFLWVMLILQLMAFVPFVFRFDLEYIILYMPVFGQLFFLYIFFRLTHSVHFFPESDNNIKLNYVKSTKYATVKINDEKADAICTAILSLMETEKPYLRMEYTLTEMAKELSILPGTLSMILNSKLNFSFPDYINSFRIKNAIHLLNDFYKKNLTIETVAYECGFNNRTSFIKLLKNKPESSLPILSTKVLN
jgi:AraC-like DNA-binding protein